MAKTKAETVWHTHYETVFNCDRNCFCRIYSSLLNTCPTLKLHEVYSFNCILDHQNDDGNYTGLHEKAQKKV